MNDPMSRFRLFGNYTRIQDSSEFVPKKLECF